MLLDEELELDERFDDDEPELRDEPLEELPKPEDFALPLLEDEPVVDPAGRPHDDAPVLRVAPPEELLFELGGVMLLLLPHPVLRAEPVEELPFVEFEELLLSLLPKDESVDPVERSPRNW